MTSVLNASSGCKNPCHIVSFTGQVVSIMHNIRLKLGSGGKGHKQVVIMSRVIEKVRCVH